MYYIFFINNIELGEIIYTAEDIKNYLLGQNQWAFSFYAPNLKYIGEGDKVVIYFAGKENRCFTSDFTISSKPYETEKKPENPVWLSMFPIRVKIQNINQWTKPLLIRDVIDKLDFIHDKKNYGLYFRQATKKIGEKDYITIIQSG